VVAPMRCLRFQQRRLEFAQILRAFVHNPADLRAAKRENCGKSILASLGSNR
jgi:hypothetical protein